MVREGSRRSTHPLGLVAVLVFSAVFTVAFGTGGYVFGLKPLVLTLRAALEVRSWQPAPAQVLSARLQRHADSDSTTWQVRARYRYEFGGKVFEGNRVGLDPTAGADNLGDWHERWHARLQAALSRGEPITVWVDPRRPSQSLIDPHPRWQMLAFRVPFALVFTGVALGAAWVFAGALWQLLRRPPSQQQQGFYGQGGEGWAAQGVHEHDEQRHAGLGQEGVGPAPARHATSAAGRSAGALWLFSLFWCGIAFPMAGILWTSDRAPWLAKALIGLFVVVGVALLAHALGQTLKAWRYAGTSLALRPARPRAGHAVECTITLPERAALQQQGRDLHLRLAQYRVDESSSGNAERRVEDFTQPARVLPLPDGSLHLSGRFEMPGDAPPHGARRSGERVDWRLELLHGARGSVQLCYDLPVEAAPAGGAHAADAPAVDRFDPRAAWAQVTPIEPLAEAATLGARLPHLPGTVQLQEMAEGWRYRFAPSGWRWAAGLVLAGLAAEALIQGRVGLHGFHGPRGFLGASLWWALAAFALYAATCRWTLWVTDSGITVLRTSWLGSRAQVLPGAATASLVHKLLFTAGNTGAERRYYAVYARPDGGSALVRLTPGLPGDAAATALGQSLAQAWAQRRGRFSPGALRPHARAHGWRPSWGWFVLLLLWVLQYA
ncbi:DUF3592 domain-containing protein [Paracidovorax sp. MALMAid1276]|uniref:DUF3592 domain-containing protein n=1 Tax=Paracidovorax sp. MALMAid1276 TaxID=3411631 RepID=UPI003B9B0ED3